MFYPLKKEAFACSGITKPVYVAGSKTFAASDADGTGSTYLSIASVPEGDPVAKGGAIENKGCHAARVRLTFLEGGDCDECTPDTLERGTLEIPVPANSGFKLPDNVAWTMLEAQLLDGQGQPVDLQANEKPQMVSVNSLYAPDCPDCLVLAPAAA